MKIVKKRILPSIKYKQQIQLVILLIYALLFIINQGYYSYIFKNILDDFETESMKRLKLISTNLADRLNKVNLERAIMGDRWDPKFSIILGREYLKVTTLEDVNINIVDKKGHQLNSQNIPILPKLPEFKLPEKHQLEIAWQGKIQVTRVYESAPGRYKKSCFYPLRSSKGDVIAILFTSMELSSLMKLKQISNTIFWLQLFLFVMLLILSTSFIKYVLKPYRQISEYAHDFAMKHYKQEKFPIKDSNESEVDFSIKSFREAINALEEKDRLLYQANLQLKEKAAKVESYNENILQSISTGVITVNTDDLITNINRYARELLGLADKEFINSPCYEVFGSDSVLTKLLKESNSSSPVTEWSITSTGQDKRNLILSVSPLKDPVNKVIGKILLIEDVTEIRKLQENIMLKEQMATLGEMSVGIAHEIRNPLAVIMGYTNLMKKQLPKDNPMSESCQAIIHEVYSMEKIVKDFLAFARPTELNPEIININELIKDVLDNWPHDITGSNIELQLQLKDNLPPVSVDPGLIQSVIRNLVQNALDAMQNSKIKILTVETGIPPSNNKEIYFSVKDTGEGIDQHTIPKIFLPFFTNKDKGTGLGLALVQKIILNHDGRITVSSNPGEPTVFTIYLSHVQT